MHTDTNNTEHTAQQNLQRNPDGRDAYATVTARIIDCLEKEVIPWRRPWKGGGFPQNLVSRRPYTGINAFILATAGFDLPYFLTFKQAQKLGGHVRKGERGLPVIYCRKSRVEKEDADTGEKGTKELILLRTYTVFNHSQCEGIPVPESHGVRAFNPIEACEVITRGYRGAPTLVHREARAYYQPRTDFVNMPMASSFDSPEAYYATLFHEFTHSTGHSSRLKREGVENVHSFGDPVYSKEELIAEMGSAFLCAHAGISPATVSNSTAYIRSWLCVLKNDKRLLISAASSAQKAADHIMGLTPQQPLAGGEGDEGTE
jgi:antirestriction protein ArdC